MTLRRIAPLATMMLLGLAGASSGQMTIGAPAGSFGSPPAGAFGSSPAGSFGAGAQAPAAAGFQNPMGAPQQMPPCAVNFMKLRQGAETRAKAIKAASERHAPPQELCNLFGQFSDVEGRMVKFIEENQRTCNIPAQALPAAKSNHAKTVETQGKICQAARFAGTGERRGPGLGDALGVRTTVPTLDSSGRSGAFATLSGGTLAGSADAAATAGK